MEKFKYLETLIDQTANGSPEIRARLGAAKFILRSLNNLKKDCSLHKRIMTLVWQVTMFGCETWTMKATDVNKICYRWSLHISWTDHKTNESLGGDGNREVAGLDHKETKKSNILVMLPGLRNTATIS